MCVFFFLLFNSQYYTTHFLSAIYREKRIEKHSKSSWIKTNTHTKHIIISHFYYCWTIQSNPHGNAQLKSNTYKNESILYAEMKFRICLRHFVNKYKMKCSRASTNSIGYSNQVMKREKWVKDRKLHISEKLYINGLVRWHFKPYWNFTYALYVCFLFLFFGLYFNVDKTSIFWFLFKLLSSVSTFSNICVVIAIKGYFITFVNELNRTNDDSSSK